VKSDIMFCPHCGELLRPDRKGRWKRNENIEWLGSALRDMGYEPEYPGGIDDAIIVNDDKSFIPLICSGNKSELIQLSHRTEITRKFRFGEKADIWESKNFGNCYGLFCSFMLDKDKVLIYCPKSRIRNYQHI
jgi:hypothetical protein